MVAAFSLFISSRIRVDIILFTLLLLGCQSVLAQSGRVDSLWQALSQVDTGNRVEIFFTQIKQHRTEFQTSEVTYAINLGLNESPKQQSPLMLAKCNILAGDLYMPDISMYNNALLHYKRALDLATHADDIEQRVFSSISIARIYNLLQLPDKAYPYLVKADEWCRDPRYATHLSLLGNHFKEIGDNYIAAGRRDAANIAFQMAVASDRFSMANCCALMQGNCCPAPISCVPPLMRRWK